MAEKGEGGSIPDELRCRRSDGRKWRCKLRVAEGKGYCEAHLQQGKLRSRKQRAPDGLKLERTNKRIIKESSNMNEILKIKEEIEDGDDDKVVQDLVHGQMEINGDKNLVKNAAYGFFFRIGASSLVYRRPILSKNVEPVPDITVKWDIFRREDSPKLVDYLRKYSDILSRSFGSPEKVAHPLFDEIFFLDDFHKARLKEEFNVEAWSFNQDVGEAIVIPAGCPYQMRKIKSCVNVVFKFLSPESASESIKVSDELRLLPVNHKEKGDTLQVNKMVINRMHAAIEEMRGVLQTE